MSIVTDLICHRSNCHSVFSVSKNLNQVFIGSPDQAEVHTTEGMTDAATGPAELPTTGALATTEVAGDAVVGKEITVGNPHMEG